MIKTINVIVYKPGYGGRFIQTILSLDDTTVPLINSDSSSRADQYSYKNLRSLYGSWCNHHLQFQDNDILWVHDLLRNPTYKVVNIAMHPIEFFVFSYHSKPRLKMLFTQVNVSPQYEYVITKFKKDNNNFPALRPDDEEANKKFTEQYSPYIINFDNFILGEQTFVQEYTKLVSYLGLPNQIDVVIELYRDWYAERKFTDYLE